MASRTSKAIPIINPDDGSHLVVHLGNVEVKKDIAAATNKSPSNSINTVDLNPQSPPSSKPSTDSLPSSDSLSSQNITETKSSLDVYARAYVPEAYRIINEVHPIFITEAPNPRALDYVHYIQSFGGYSYLLDQPFLKNARYNCLEYPQKYFEAEEFLQYEKELSISDDYERYFECLIGREFTHHIVEHKHQSLYNQRLETYPESTDLYSLFWPGLLEGMPFIQAGDRIELRQLIPMQEPVRLALMENWMKEVGWTRLENRRTEAHKLLPPGWTGHVYNARVHTVLNAQEKVILYAPGLGGSMNFNLILPVEKRFYKSRLNAVAHFGRVLHTININEVSKDSSNDHWVKKMLFPDLRNGVWQEEVDPWTSRQKWFDELLNFEQKRAISAICARNFGIVPYLISGPPGTGKTKTLVETALHLIQLSSTSHILVCAPSNAAADTLLDRLRHNLDVDELFRLNSPTRNIIEVPKVLRKYCSTALDESFTLPDFPRLMKFKIVVSSCQDASLLVNACVTNSDLVQFEHNVFSSLHPTMPSCPKRLHWGALLLDEAAQAVEPEALIPLSVIAPLTDCQLIDQPLFIMAGDEYQLGPRTYSHQERFKTSLFGRLFRLPLYCDHPLARKTRSSFETNMLPMIRPPFANLIRNYRSHPAILAVSSYAFYADTLITNGEATSSLDSLNIWRGRQWPVLFVSNTSDEDHHHDGGGWFNRGEARKAVDIAKQVMTSGIIEEKDICIMSPFAAQVRLIRQRCRDENLWNINIGPCEAFQGLESRFVILCTTRARERFLDRDVEVSKGIIRQPQRMNVCLTRARHGLVVIGNVNLLSSDPEWVRFLSFCQRNGLVKGEVDLKISKREELRLESLLLTKAHNLELDTDATSEVLGILLDS
jgi:helicase MOV-10